MTKRKRASEPAEVAEEPKKPAKLPVIPIELTEDQQQGLNKLDKVSDQIRYLNSLGFSRSQIAKFLDKRYQHVRNVLTAPVKRPKK
jgi:hypothetical protein